MILLPSISQRNGKQGINLEWPYKPKGTREISKLYLTQIHIAHSSDQNPIFSGSNSIACYLFRIGLATKLHPMLFIWNVQS